MIQQPRTRLWNVSNRSSILPLSPSLQPLTSPPASPPPSDAPTSTTPLADLESYLLASSSSTTTTISSAPSTSHTHTWRLLNFSLLPHSKTDPVDSLPFQVGRGSFRMRVFPYGRVHEADDRVSVFIRCGAIITALPTTPSEEGEEEKEEKTSRRGRSRNSDTGGVTRPTNPTSSSSSSSSSSHRSRHHQPTLTVRYRFRFVHPSGDRTLDETIPAPHDSPYSYSFTVDDEHEGAFVTHQSLHSRHIITGDALILQVDMEVMQAQKTDFVFSHGLPIRGEGAEEEEKDVERVLGKQFLQAWRQGKDCDVYIRVKGGEEGAGGGGVDDDEEEEEKEEEDEDSAGSEDDAHKPPTRSHHMKKQRTSLTSSLPHTRTSLATVNVIPAHKFVLSSRSAVFAVMLSHDMRERKESVIEIDDIDRETVLRLLWFLYCGLLPTTAALTAVASATTVQKPSFQSSSRSYPLSSTSLLPPSILPTPITHWSEAVALYHSAHKYALPHLAELTAWSIVQHLSDDTVLPTLQLSECYREQSGARTLFEAGKEWMCRRFEQVIRRTCEMRGGGDVEDKKDAVSKGPREGKERDMKDRQEKTSLTGARSMCTRTLQRTRTGLSHPCLCPPPLLLSVAQRSPSPWRPSSTPSGVTARQHPPLLCVSSPHSSPQVQCVR